MKIIRSAPASHVYELPEAADDGSRIEVSSTDEISDTTASAPTAGRPTAGFTGEPGGARGTRQTPGLRSQAARTIQRIWRGHASRRASRQATLQGEMARVCRRQAELWDLGARLPAGVALHPGLLGEATPGARKRRRAGAGELDSTPPCQMNVEQRLARLKELHADAWARTKQEVTERHATFLQRLGDRDLQPEPRRRLLGQVRDDLFVWDLPANACWEAGFFATGHRPVTIRHRTFRPPVADVQMQDI